MAHIKVPEGVPGILGPMKAYPETARALNELAEQILVVESKTLPKADREVIASYVSYLNSCVFCSESHGAVADFHAKKPGMAHQVWKDVSKAPISERLKALLNIAGKVQKDGRSVAKNDVEAAVKLGATDRDIHDTVLIAAAFCMYNRYVDGLNTFAPAKGDPAYQQMGTMLGTKGYKNAV